MALPFAFHTPALEDRAQFDSAPWCTKYFSDPTLKAVKITFKITPTLNSLVYKTLSTNDTIRAFQAFLKAPTPEKQSGELQVLISLGSGLNSYEHTAHGGFVGLVFDEILGVPAILARPKGKSSMTASLKVDYKKPMRTPGIYLCRAWVERTDGRKIHTGGSMEDGQGNVLATSEALFVVVDGVKTMEKL